MFAVQNWSPYSKELLLLFTKCDTVINSKNLKVLYIIYITPQTTNVQKQLME